MKPISLKSITELHAHLIRAQKHTDPYSVSPVFKSYALSPLHLCKARLVFAQIERPTLLIWNYLIRGLSISDNPNESIQVYRQLYRQGLVGDNLTFIYVLKACARVCDILHGRKVHLNCVKLGFKSYLFVSNALIYMYGHCGRLECARNVFDEMTDRDLVSWNSLICGYSQHNRFTEVLGLFNAMREVNVEGDAVTMVKVVLACSFLNDRDTIDFVVKYIIKKCICVDVFLGNTLIDMYGRRGSVDLARQVFDSMSERNIVSWNTMIMGYSKIGNLIEARKLFDEMPRRDVISWTSLITGYSKANQHSNAVKLFEEMMKCKVKPDEITAASVLSACAHLGSLNIGELIHNYIDAHGVRSDVYVGNSLIDMYCKCGEINKAIKVFQEMKEKDSISWSSIISGLAVNGLATSALNLFSEMLKNRVKPTSSTFVGVLLACTHAGLVDKGLEHFQNMENIYELTPEMKHYGCIVDLLCRTGDLHRAYEFIKKMPLAADVVLWRILLGGCKVHGDVHLAEIVMKKLLESDPSCAGNYVLLSNTYAASDRWNDASKMRELMVEDYVHKPLGWSSVEIKGTTDNQDTTAFLNPNKNLSSTVIEKPK